MTQRPLGGDPAAVPHDSSSAFPKASTPNSGQCLTTLSENRFFTVGLFRAFTMPMCIDLTPECLGVFFWKYLVCNYFAVLAAWVSPHPLLLDLPLPSNL